MEKEMEAKGEKEKWRTARTKKVVYILSIV